MYEHNPYEPKGRRLPWMDFGEVRKTVQALLDEGRVEVLWNHILGEGHRVSGDEVRAALANGAYELHETVDGRYIATYVPRHAPLGIVAVFELRESCGILEVFVLTAFPAESRRARGPLRRR